MSALLNKSSKNLIASKLLIDQNLFAPSVHCSYYGFIQYLICKLANEWNQSIEEFSRVGISESGGYSSHKNLIRKTSDTIKTKHGILKGLDIERKIKDLKKMREKSDYQNIEINKEISEDALSLSNKLIEITNTYLS